MTDTTVAESDGSARSLAKRVGFNSVSYGYAQLVTLLAQLVVVPFFLRYWGAPLYGDWLVLSGIPMMLTLLDFGVTQASASKATVFAASGNWFGARQTLQTGLAFTLSVACVAFLLTLSVSAQVDWVSLLALGQISRIDAQVIVQAMAFYLLIGFIGGPIDGWYRVIDQTAIGAFLLANRRLMDVLISIVILITGGSPVHLAWGMVSGQAFMLIGLLIIARRLSPRPLMGLAHASLNELRSIWKPALGYAGFPLSQVVTLQGGIQILNQVSGPSAVVAFTMARTLMRLIIQFGVVCNSALKPEISRLVGQGKTLMARDFTLRASTGVFAISCLAYALVIAVGPQVVEWWGGGEVSIGRGDLAIIGLHALINVAWFVPAALLIATNRHTALATTYFVASLVALLAWIAARNYISPVIGASLLMALPELAVLSFLCLAVFRNSTYMALVRNA